MTSEFSGHPYSRTRPNMFYHQPLPMQLMNDSSGDRVSKFKRVISIYSRSITRVLQLPWILKVKTSGSAPAKPHSSGVWRHTYKNMKGHSELPEHSEIELIQFLEPASRSLVCKRIRAICSLSRPHADADTVVHPNLQLLLQQLMEITNLKLERC